MIEDNKPASRVISPISVYEFGDRNWDNTTKILKDGKDTFCPKSVFSFMPNPQVPTEITLFKPTCFKECPFIQQASKTYTETGKVEKGYLINCMERPIFTEIKEKTKTVKLIH